MAHSQRDATWLEGKTMFVGACHHCAGETFIKAGHIAVWYPKCWSHDELPFLGLIWVKRSFCLWCISPSGDLAFQNSNNFCWALEQMPAKNNQGQSQCFGTVRMGVATYGVLMWDKHSPYLVSAVSAFSFTSKANNWTWMGVIDPTTFMDLQRDLSSVQICTGKDSFFLWVLAQFCKDAPYLGFLLYWEVFVGANHCQCSLMQSAVVQRLTLHRGSWKWAPKIGTWHENSPKWAVADFGGISWTETNPLSSKFMMWLKTFNWKYMYIYIIFTLQFHWLDAVYSALQLDLRWMICGRFGCSKQLGALYEHKDTIFILFRKVSEFYVTIFMAVRLGTIHMIHWYGFWQSLVCDVADSDHFTVRRCKPSGADSRCWPCAGTAARWWTSCFRPRFQGFQQARGRSVENLWESAKRV